MEQEEFERLCDQATEDWIAAGMPELSKEEIDLFLFGPTGFYQSVWGVSPFDRYADDEMAYLKAEEVSGLE